MHALRNPAPHTPERSKHYATNKGIRRKQDTLFIVTEHSGHAEALSSG